ncbi:hypothetical protein [Streptomyces goshikiensis]|uniref:hypothetical protein n=1 Tax=Streptomyces goshikiensis TaxID=1942 RepID=UPI002ADF7105|nr:hypothetical protein [Streptomyces goshikiensis]
MSVVAAAIVDSRNVFHQAGDAIGLRATPTVPGVRAAMARYGFDVAEVHVGLALARAKDRQALARQHANNEAYRARVLADGGHVLLGELHQKSGGAVEEKMVDCACCVRITRFVDEIAFKRSNVEAIIVLSKDIDLQPAVDYAVGSAVPIFVGALDVVQHRPHPYVLLGPHAYAEITQSAQGVSGHSLRESLASMLHAGSAEPWTVRGAGASATLVHRSGLRARPASGVVLPASGRSVSLHPVDVEFPPSTLPVLICDEAPPSLPTWDTAVVIQRAAPMALKVKLAGGANGRVHFPQGGVVPGDTVLVHRATGRAVGRLPLLSATRLFDPDEPLVVRVISKLPRGGALAADSSGRRGLLNTNQPVAAGQRVAAVQVDLKSRGPVWVAISTPLP